MHSSTSTSTTKTYSDFTSLKTDSDSPSSLTGHSFSSTLSCQQHDLFFVSLCVTCAGLNLCLRCLPNHQGHQIRIIPIYEGQASLSRLITESKSIQQSLKDSKESIKTVQEKIKASSDSVIEEWKNIIYLHIRALEERRQDLLQLTETILETKVVTLNQQQEKINKCMDDMNSLIQHAEQLCLEPATSSLTGSSLCEENPRYFDYYEKLIQFHLDNPIPTVPFTNDFIRLRAVDPHLLGAIKCMGRIESGLCPKTSLVLGPRHKKFIFGKPCAINIQLKDVCGDPVAQNSNKQEGELISTLYGPLSGGHATEVPYKELM